MTSQLVVRKRSRFVLNISIRPLTLADLKVASDISRDARQTSLDYQAKIRHYLQLQPDGWFLALLDEKPVGMVGATDYGSFAYIGLLGVHPTAQRRGIATALMDHVLAWLEQRGCPTILLDATEEGTPLYLRYSFVEEDQVTHWVREQKLLPASPYSSLQVQLAPLQLADVTEVTAFDAPYFGAGRAAVFTSSLLDYPARSFVARDSTGEVCGYLFARDTTLGPWIARDQQVADALLRQALLLPFPEQREQTYTPTANEEAAHLLEQYGFRKLRTLHHMRRGKPIEFRIREGQYGQTSLGLG
jgi:ribosomal protein S18 acetylase RimI-like enzyme